MLPVSSQPVLRYFVDVVAASFAALIWMASIPELTISRLSEDEGTTLEQYLIQQRVDLAKRVLLDPRLNVGGSGTLGILQSRILCLCV